MPTKRLAAFIALLLAGASSLRAQQSVAVSEDAQSYTLDNGIIRATISRKSGDIYSMKYKGVELMATWLKPDGTPDLERDPPGDPGWAGRGMTDHNYGFWSHDTITDRIESKITIDPKSNGGTRGEISVKGFSDGKKLGHGPGAPPEGDFAADIEIRYCLGRGETGIYTYCIFEHKPEYPQASMGEAVLAKLSEVFDWMLVNQQHNFPASKMSEPGYNKYNYTTIQFEHPVFGWAGTKSKIGFFFVNASVEYLTGPPTKVEFLCHSHNTILNYWRSSHYGGGGVDVAKGEYWSKVIGPFMLYVNEGGDPQQLWADAKQQQVREAAKWPYDWVAGADYPYKAQRATVKGRIVLHDPLTAGATMSQLRVGLSHPDYHITTDRPAATNAPADITWQTDSKHYSFWTRGQDDGAFIIPAVRPGKYTLHAFCDGVLGEYAKTDITVEPGKDLDLGNLDWQVVRRGKPVWEIGTINRSGSEFVKGDDYFHNGMEQVYAQMFPSGVNYVIGKSDYSKDWYFKQVPHPNKSELSPWTIRFDMPATPKGKATLRISFAGKQASLVAVAVNDTVVGRVIDLWSDSSLGRNQIRGNWAEREVPFDASMLKAGKNTIKLSFEGAGVIYDYLRLELDETKTN